VLFVVGSRRRGVIGAMIGMVGGLVARGAIADLLGHLRAVTTPRPDLDRRYGDGKRDIVEEASWESFPASDPPSWTR
jgi:hypothetical protein